ncbi:MAG: lipocalin family protein [Bacteroidales bacterium]|nr:lipocalin family protein [Bacteroidales bacterium]
MKKILILLSIITLAAVSCEKAPMLEVDPQLEVNYNNISGQWTLVEWNGSNMAEGTYVYLDIVRNDKTYTMYQNMDSFTNVPHILTGSYQLSTDVELGAIIRGAYDHDSGEWAHRYIVKSLTANEMLWVATDDLSFTQKFVRVSAIPVK